MSISVNAYATTAPKSPFEKITIERRDLKPTDVLIDIRFAGICHSDIHIARSEWGETDYPLVPGHEIAGVVSEVGAEVSTYSVGDRVGVGCMVRPCGTCANCVAGEEQYRLVGNIQTYGGMLDGRPTDGGYSEKIVVDEGFVLGIPEGIELDVAAPLLCAGITQRRRHVLPARGNVRPDRQHRVGADSDRPLPLAARAQRHPGQRGRPGRAAGGQRVLADSDAPQLGGLEFCAEHHLGAEIELIDASRIDEAYDRVVGSDVRYRFVIDAATIAS